jgi:aldehyde:ferredoxin oxidoreductase
VVSGSSAGYWGPYLKFSGYDGIIITGASKTPVYLWINNGRAELRDASHIWGKPSHETVDFIKREIGQRDAKVACIGPAGENLVKSAMVLSDYNNSASHGGGVIMGSKKLKAIAVWGTNRVPIMDNARLVEAGNRWREKIKPILYPQGRFNVGYGHELGTLIHRNWQSTLFPEANRGFEEEEYTPRPCFQCNRQCPFDARLTAGKHAGYVATLNAGGEHYEGAAYTFGVGGQAVHYLADVLDQLGMDGCQFGCAAGVAFEAYEKGLLTAKQTDGLQLKWGDADAVEKLMNRVARREGWLGNILADGPKATADAIGGEALKFVVHIKGGAPALHDWRPYLSQMLGQMTATGGGKPRFQGFEIRGDAGLGYPEKTDARAREGKAKETFTGGLYRLFCGAAGVCWFGARGGVFPHSVEALQAATGWRDFTEQEALEIGERTWQMEHLLHLRFGWSPEEDLANIGPRFLEPVPDGQFKGFTVARFLPGLLHDFYTVCGWDARTGRPRPETLKRLKLEDFSFLAGE